MRHNPMIKILFICHGNICRSPMAEFVMKKLVNEAGLGGEFHIQSAATSNEEIGCPVYPPVRSLLSRLGISCDKHSARRMTKADYADYDLLIGMDYSNLRAMRSFYNGDPDGKLKLLLDYTDRPGEVSDPWYSRDFEKAYRDISEGCEGLLKSLTKNK